ncbi:hypothetical protein X474_24685 [Dethiosulfatarculus sandiegensis]|uniref:Uncharacterized protein n=1 Tax=Dethiosulfatarculus sandiegensis TaxID=1429043 RepID=A0A0D2G9Q5_9BACT|nr:hypothetical protein X474_24685 [Dethiosulfatarculus sandiegensis]
MPDKLRPLFARGMVKVSLLQKRFFRLRLLKGADT